jgi:hypothetical protein
MGKKRTLERSIRLIRAPDDSGVGVVCLSRRAVHTLYFFKEIPCAIGGRGFALRQFGGDKMYHVRIGRPEECSCECLGFLAHSNCKHIKAMLALLKHDIL